MLSSFSVRKPFTVIVAVVLILVLGFVSVSKMTTDLIPNINLPYAVVITTYPGAAPEQVEDSVTRPVEAALAAVSNLVEISSVSNENYSMVILEFVQDTDMDSISLELRESLDMIKNSLPDSVGSPMILKLNPNMVPVMVIAADFKDKNRSEASVFVEDKILSELDSIAGVASASAGGLVKSEISVVLSAVKIDAVNDRILEKVDEKLLENKTKLDDAQNDLYEGRQQLNDKKQEITDGKKKIATAKEELAASKTELAKQQEQLDAAQASLDEARSKLDAGKAELEASEIKLKAAEAELLSARAAAQAAGGDLPQQQLEQLAGIQSGLVELEIKKTELAASHAGLNAKQKELDAGFAALAAGEKQLAAGEKAITANEAALTGGEAALKNAESELTSGQARIDQAYDEFETARQQALEKANMKGKITAEMLEGILKAQNISYPAGYIQQSGDDVLVRVGDDITDMDALKKLKLIDLVELDMSITMDDVADVMMIDNAADTFTKVNGNEAVLITLQKQTEYSTADVASAVRDRMDELMEKNEGLSMTALMDQGVYVDMVVSSVGSNLLYGAILAIIILLIFLRDIKLTLVVGVSIPLSLLVALLLMYFSGISLNIISMSGLALGVGMLVDNSIVVIENIYRMRSEGASAKDAAIYGTKQVSAAIISSTLTTCAVFLPIVFTQGMTRQLFTDLALTVTYSLLASLLVALSFVPMMAAGSLRNSKEKAHPFFEKVQEVYGRAMEFSLRHKWIPITVVTGLFALTVAGVLNMGTAFFPEMNTPQMTVSLEMDRDSTFDQSSDVAKQAMDIIGGIDGVETVGVSLSRNAGSGLSLASIAGGGLGGNGSVSVFVLLDEDRGRTNDEIANEIIEKTADLDCTVTASGSSMDIAMLTGSGVSINIKGRELDTLKELAGDISQLVKDVKGTENVTDGLEQPAKELRVIVDKDAAMAKSVTVGEVYGVISKLLADTATATTLDTDSGSYPVKVMSDSDEKLLWKDLADYTFTAAVTGEEVRLGDVASLEETTGFESITRIQQQRYVTVSAEIAQGYNIGLVSRDIETMLSDYELPVGYTLELTGENESIKDAMNDLVLMLVLAVVFVYLVMVAQFQSLKSPFIVLLTLPLAYTGGFIALYVTGQVLSVVAAIGFIMLTGIVVNNGIVLVDFINQLRESGMQKHEAIIKAGKTRLRPILMTSLTTIFAMLTMSFGVGMGTELSQPMAITMIGGLVYATLLTLVFVPVVYDLFNRKDQKIQTEVQ